MESAGEAKENNPLIGCFPIEIPVQSILDVPGVVGVASDVTSNPWKSCLATVSCPEAACSCL